jgi:hypothetical protein
MQVKEAATYQKGSFGYDLQFLHKYDSVILLTGQDSSAQVIVSARYQGKVFTSTAEGMQGKSFGWIHYSAFDAAIDPHMNAYGGENRLMAGTGRRSLFAFFPAGKPQTFENWKTPAAFDTENWQMVNRTSGWVLLQKDMQLQTYRGRKLSLTIRRDIRIMEPKEITAQLGLQLQGIKAVGYETGNQLVNTGLDPWNDTTGIPCLWVLDMFPPSPHTTVIIPYMHRFQNPPTPVISARSQRTGSGWTAGSFISKPMARQGANSASALLLQKILRAVTMPITIYSLLHGLPLIIKRPTSTRNGEPRKEFFQGDAVNAYNDGPLADGKQMGPFYELESVSPAARLAPGQSLLHKHAVVHLTGEENSLDLITQKLFGISLAQIKASLNGR